MATKGHPLDPPAHIANDPEKKAGWDRLRDKILQEEEEKRRKRETQRTGDRSGGVQIGFFDQIGRWANGISDQGRYFKVSPRGKGGKLSDEQIKEVLLACALEKGFTTIHFYKGNKIDKETSTRASAILKDMMQPGRALHGMRVTISTDKMATVEPWRNDLIGRFMHAQEARSEAKKEREKNRKDAKKEEGLSRKYGDAVTDRIMAPGSRKERRHQAEQKETLRRVQKELNRRFNQDDGRKEPQP